MKYIRTKDGIIDLSNVTIGENGWKNVKEYIAFKQEDQEEPIKVADTIEELCDEFVLIGICGIPYDSKQVLDEEDKHKKDFLIELVKSQDYEIYGAIWVGADLHSVAKMNEKGELELL